jgi:hypothetical protein
LDHSQVRRYTALARHIVLTMAALAVCSITAAHAKTRAPAPTLPTRPDAQPPTDPGLVPLTVAEIKRLFILITRRLHDAWRASHIPDSGSNKVRPGMEDAGCQNGAGSSALSSGTRR